MPRLLLVALALLPRLAAADHAVFNLADNRLLAHVTHGGGLVAVAGSPGFAKYLNGGKPNLPWKLGEKLDGRRVALAVDSYARLTLPVAEPARTLWARLSSSRARDVEVLLAGKKIGQAAVTGAGWQTVKVALDPPVAPGEAELTLVLGKRGEGVAVE